MYVVSCIHEYTKVSLHAVPLISYVIKKSRPSSDVASPMERSVGSLCLEETSTEGNNVTFVYLNYFTLSGDTEAQKNSVKCGLTFLKYSK